MGWKNKYCSICSKNNNKSHNCHKNWNSSSTSMEPAIIREGFEYVASKGLFIKLYIGDDNQAVVGALSALPWKVEKEDCINHTNSNFFSKLLDWCNEFKLVKIIGN